MQVFLVEKDLRLKKDRISQFLLFFKQRMSLCKNESIDRRAMKANIRIHTKPTDENICQNIGLKLEFSKIRSFEKDFLFQPLMNSFIAGIFTFNLD